MTRLLDVDDQAATLFGRPFPLDELDKFLLRDAGDAS